jgi:hypothetical protein
VGNGRLTCGLKTNITYVKYYPERGDKMKRLSEYAKEFKGNPIVPMADLNGKEIVIVDVRMGPTRYGDALYIDFVADDDKQYTTITSSNYIMDACMSAKEAGELPILAKFVKHGRYWRIE